MTRRVTPEPPHDESLHDTLKLLERRRVLTWLAGASVLPLVSCAVASTRSADGGIDSCGTIPTETQGPYPGDGSNGVNTLSQSGIVRSDIRSSFGTYAGTAAGIPLDVTLTLVNVNANCAPLVGRAVYVWHCDINGQYSLYTVSAQNYLRGVQQTDANGDVTFRTIFPACYSGRWPHIHFEVYSSIGRATAGGNASKTSQLALPQDVCSAVYATSNYTGSAANLAGVSLSSDNIFSDGSSLQLASVTGSVSAGYVATLQVGVSV